MKKIGLICATTLICGALAGCGNNNSSKQSKMDSLKAENSSLKARREKLHESSLKKRAKKARSNEVQVEGKNENQTHPSQAAVSSSTKQQNVSKSNNKVTVRGHTFHHENFYGNDVLVGDNGEGDIGEWAANDPGAQQDPTISSQVQAAYNQQ